MNILSKNSQQKLKDFSTSALNAISVFTKTMEDLASINLKIDLESEATIEKITELDEFNKALLSQKADNDKIISKIKVIIED